MPMGKGTYGSKRGRPAKKKAANGSIDCKAEDFATCFAKEDYEKALEDTVYFILVASNTDCLLVS